MFTPIHHFVCFFQVFGSEENKKTTSNLKLTVTKMIELLGLPFDKRDVSLVEKKNGFLEAKRKEMFVQRCNPQKDGGLEVCIFPTSTH